MGIFAHLRFGHNLKEGKELFEENNIENLLGEIDALKIETKVLKKNAEDLQTSGGPITSEVGTNLTNKYEKALIDLQGARKKIKSASTFRTTLKLPERVFDQPTPPMIEGFKAAKGLLGNAQSFMLGTAAALKEAKGMLTERKELTILLASVGAVEKEIGHMKTTVNHLKLGLEFRLEKRIKPEAKIKRA